MTLTEKWIRFFISLFWFIVVGAVGFYFGWTAGTRSIETPVAVSPAPIVAPTRPAPAPTPAPRPAPTAPAPAPPVIVVVQQAPPPAPPPAPVLVAPSPPPPAVVTVSPPTVAAPVVVAPPIPALPPLQLVSSLREETALGARWLIVQVSLLGDSSGVIRWTLEVNGATQPWGPRYGTETSWEVRLAHPPSGTQIVPLAQLRDGTIVRGLIIRVP